MKPSERAVAGQQTPRESLLVILPYPPSVNNLYASVRQADGTTRRVKTAAAREYAERVKKITQHAYWSHVERLLELTEGLAVTIDLYPPDKRRRDADGPVKITLDSVITSGLGIDDSRVVWLLVVKHEPDRANPRAEVRVEAR